MREAGTHGNLVVRVLRTLARETVWAVRRLGRTPGFVGVAVLTLAVAIAPSLIFRLVDHAVLPPLPYPRSQDLVAIWQRFGFGRMATSYPKHALPQRKESHHRLRRLYRRGVLP
jgi:hypothetical protein